MAKPNLSNQSSAALAGLNLTLEPLESLIMKSLQHKIQNLTGAKTVWATSTDKTLALQTLFGAPQSGTNDITVSYPYIFLIPGSYSEPEGRLHNRRAALRGLPSVVLDDNKRAFNVRFMAMDLAVNFQYVTNDFKQAHKMAALWLFARKNGWLKFDIQYGRAHFGVGIDMDSTVNVPQREADLEDVSEYTVEASLVVQGYMSFPTLIEQQVANKIQGDVTVPDGAVCWAFESTTDTSPVTGPPVAPQQR